MTDRDKYGLARSSKYLPIELQLIWEREYQVTLNHRRERWAESMDAKGLPEKSDKVQRFVRKGVPGHLRAVAWFKYGGGEQLQRRHPGLYFDALKWAGDVKDGVTGNQTILKSLDTSFESIEKDLYRTFPENIYFQKSLDPTSDIYIQSLRRILQAFAAFSLPQGGNRPFHTASYPIGYAQSLNYIAALLLLIFTRTCKSFPETEEGRVLLYGFFEDGDLRTLPPDEIGKIEARVFFTMAALIDGILPRGVYQDPDLAGALLEQDVFWTGLVDKRGGQFGLSKFRDWIRTLDPNPPAKAKRKKKEQLEPFPGPLKIVTFAWMLTLFVGVTPLETTLRIWDCLFYEGATILHRVILTMFKINERTLTDLRNGTEAWTLVKDLPKGIWDAHRFMEIVFERRKLVPPPVIRRTKEMTWKIEFSGGGVGDIDAEELEKIRRELAMATKS